MNASDKGRLVEAYNFKFVPREKLEFNPNNDFSMKDIDELAETLLLNGLLHNLVAYYEEDRDRYILESGGRRLKAMVSFGLSITMGQMKCYQGINRSYTGRILPLYLKMDFQLM